MANIRCRWWSLALRRSALVGLMTLALDITEQYHTEQQLELYRNDLEQRVEQRTARNSLPRRKRWRRSSTRARSRPSCSTPAIA